MPVEEMTIISNPDNVENFGGLVFSIPPVSPNSLSKEAKTSSDTTICSLKRGKGQTMTDGEGRPPRSATGYPKGRINKSNRRTSRPPLNKVITKQVFRNNSLYSSHADRKGEMIRSIGVVRNTSSIHQPTGANLHIRFKLQLRKYTQAFTEFQKRLLTLKNLHEEILVTKREIIQITEKDPGEVFDWIKESGLKDMLKNPNNQKEEIKSLAEKIKMMNVDNENLKKKVEELLVQIANKEEEIKQQDTLNRGMKNEETMSFEIEKLNNDISTIAHHVNALKEKLISNHSSGHGELEISDSEICHETENITEKVIWTINTLENRHLADLSELKKLNALNKSLLEKCATLERVQSTKKIKSTENHETKMNRFIEKLEDLCVLRGGFINVCTSKKVFGSDQVPPQMVQEEMDKHRLENICNLLKSLNVSKTVTNESVSNTTSKPDSCGKNSQCRCAELEVQVTEMETSKKVMQGKINILYQKYRQYKSECNLMKKKIEAIEKKHWMKKLFFF